MAIVPNIIGMVRGINDRKREHKIDNAKKNFLNDPEGAIAAITDISGQAGIEAAREYEADVARRNKTRQDSTDRSLGLMRDHLRGLPEGSDMNTAFDQMAPFMSQLGVDGELYSGFRQAATANPNILMDDDTWKAFVKDKYTTQTHTPGSVVTRGGKELLRVPYATKTVNTAPGAVSSVFDPNTGEFVTEQGGPAPGFSGNLDLATLRPLFVAQESSGDYTAVNKDTGALGRYQVMPETGKTLAARVGVAWRPDLMRKNTPEAQKYQDAIGNAAMQEAIDLGKGDPNEIFGYYYGGSNKKNWGPKTRKYQQEMMDRLSGGPGNGAGASIPGSRGPSVGRTTVTNPKPEKTPTTYRAASREELAAAGYPEGTAAQVDSNGKLVNLKTPPAPKAGAKAQTPEDRAIKKGELSTSLAQLASSYMQLHSRGGIVDPNRSMIGNLMARAGSSAVGQAVGGAVGTESQSIREQVNNLRPLLVQQIREATGMSAKAMDSNVELKFYMQAATDPTKDIISNLAAVQVLDSVYGNGRALSQSLPPGMMKRVAHRAGVLMKNRPISGPASGAPAVGTKRGGYTFMGGNPREQKNWRKD